MAASSSIREQDRLGRLPKDLLESILERLPFREAVKTSTLSKNWRYNWVSMKTINLDATFSRSFKNWSVYAKAVYDIMVLHEGIIESLVLHPYPYSMKSQFLIKALHIAATKVVKNLAVTTDAFMIPLYSFSHITHLKIVGIKLTKPPPSILFFPKLIGLDCRNVNFLSVSFDIFMSGCPLLQTLSMDSCGPSRGGPTKFNICSASLKHLVVYGESGPVFDINAKNLESLIATPPKSKDCPLRIVALLNSLKKLVLSCVFLEMNDGASFLLPIIQSLPSLVELEIETSNMCSSAKNKEQVMQSKKGTKKNKMLERLLFVKLTAPWGVMQNELSILKFLLAQSPTLERMVIRVQEYSDRDVLNINSELMGYEKASPEVQIVFSRI